jgi:hypothetical protein
LVPDYRIYVMSSGNHIEGMPSVVTCASDAEAIEVARRRLDGRDIEVWEGARAVTPLKAADAR